MSANAALQVVDDPVQLKFLQSVVSDEARGVRTRGVVLLVLCAELPALSGADQVPAPGSRFPVQDHVVNVQIEEIQGLDLPRGVCRGACQCVAACPSQDVTGLRSSWRSS